MPSRITRSTYEVKQLEWRVMRLAARSSSAGRAPERSAWLGRMIVSRSAPITQTRNRVLRRWKRVREGLAERYWDGRRYPALALILRSPGLKTRSMHTFRLRLSVGALVVATCWANIGRAPRTFTPYTPATLPQRAQGDFDGDGHGDVALIQDRANGSRVSISLSGSSGVVYLSANVGSLIAEDIDGDGDLDLVAGTPTGQVMAWINDGHGRFTLKKARPSSRVSAEAVFADTLRAEPAALGVAAPVVAPDTRNWVAVVATLARPPTVLLACGLHTLSLASPRAPPVVLRFS
jgi:hypothetical protein